ncbi:YrdB family protein [Paenibacillus nasutitermitis]|uniref:DUF2568 domain-containing protein n=1 Tax=Paenibacillus nasutitermitis TaxID=1652958 RepID=A0A916ZCK5_9BACL|nr:YrdB family protein [Paenibacillus nasutitermitis]GGD87241.1 hypothetical protein GCM10010911_52090 [Paenibacillus nasutitermitis]
MIMIQSVLLLVLFLVELGSLAAFGYWGFHMDKGMLMKILLGIGTPLVVAIIWGTFIAPKASIPVSLPLRALLQLIVFTLAAAALYAAGQKQLAVGFLAVALLDWTLVHAMKL